MQIEQKTGTEIAAASYGVEKGFKRAMMVIYYGNRENRRS